MDDLIPQLNIVVQSPEDGGSLTDPLNVIPDEYEDYEDYAEDTDDYKEQHWVRSILIRK